MLKHVSYKIRVYPTYKQKEQFAKAEGATRYVRNRILSEIKNYHKETGLYKDLYERYKEVTKWKKEPETIWLKEIPSDVIDQEIKDLDIGFKRFFKKISGYPKKKKKLFGCAIRFVFDHRHSGKVKNWLNKNVILTKLGKIKLSEPDRLPVQMPKMITMSRNGADQYFISFSVEQDVKEKIKTNKSVGIDLGIKNLVTCSDGTIFNGKRLLQKKSKIMRFLKRQQRKLSHKQGFRKGEKKSNRYLKQKLKVAKIHNKIKNIRNDVIHKITCKLTDLFDVICLEDLNVKGMIKNKKLSRNLSDSSFGEIKRQIVYKSNWYCRQVLFTNRFDPTSKMCSGCGQIHEMKLSDRRMVCDCGLDLDRDLNAAINILKICTGENSGFYARGAVNKPNLSESNEMDLEMTRTVMEPYGSEKREPKWLVNQVGF